MFVLLTRLCLCSFVCRRIPPSQAAIALLLQEVRSAGCWHKLKGLAISLDAWRAMLAQNDHVRVLRLLCSGVNRQSVNIISIDNRQSTIDTVAVSVRNSGACPTLLRVFRFSCNSKSDGIVCRVRQNNVRRQGD